MKKHPELKKEDIKTVFISPCPAKFSWVKNTDKEDEVPCVDYVVDQLFRLSLFPPLQKRMQKGRLTYGTHHAEWKICGTQRNRRDSDT